MTQFVDSTTPPVNRIMSRRRFLKMGAIVAAVGVAGSTALAGSRSLVKAVKADSRHRGGNTAKTAEHLSKSAPNPRTVQAANRSERFARMERPLRAEARSVAAAQPQRATERSSRVAHNDRHPRAAERPTRVASRTRREAERATQVARAERPSPSVQRANRFAHIERASSQADTTPVLAQVQRAPQMDIDERPLKSPVVQVERTSVVTPSTTFTRPAYPAESDSASSFSTPRSFAKMERYLELYNSHTGESLKTVYWAVGKYLPSALRDVNWLLRDHHSNDSIPMDPELLDLLYNLSMTLEVRPSFQIISAYRSPATNAMLRMMSSGVAEHSQHIKGKAVDIRLPGSSLAVIRRAALSLQAGGVGYYPWSNFIHLDTGPVRSWLA